MICSPELPFLVLGLLFYERGYILLYGGTFIFWQRGLWDSSFQNPSESSDRASMFTCVNGNVSCLCNKRLQKWPTV